ncbi:aminotransferase class V-fold PLP-dependent enzyme [Streptomyces sp. Da 82-17]|uniref:aminotransferase class V-fold PLP-dependent enzyme n=1 Tax=Streptomyces sp. Da 82-17 TaxID=3377116 RepID=UPI0038D373E5
MTAPRDPAPTPTAPGGPRLPVTYPLPTVPLDDAIARQFRLLECTAAHFDGRELFAADVGVVPESGRPRTTARVEAVLADFFGAEDAALVQSAGTGAIRAALDQVTVPGAGPLLIHDAPVYRTTEVTLRGTDTVRVDLNDPAALQRALSTGRFRWAYVQHTRQRLGDAYELGAVLAVCRAAGVRSVVDDNYAVLRVPHCGVELGADASCFSLFKLHGPEGVGVVVGAGDLVGRVRRANYSGGGQVQGHQALDALRALTHVPVMWALQSRVGAEVAERLAAGEVAGVAEVRIANAQDRCLLVRLNAPVARALPEAAARHGAAPYPVGANSRYEIAPLVYRLSGSSLADAPELADWAVRVNPMRAGADLVVNVLRRALADLNARGDLDAHGGLCPPAPAAQTTEADPNTPTAPNTHADPSTPTDQPTPPGGPPCS